MKPVGPTTPLERIRAAADKEAQTRKELAALAEVEEHGRSIIRMARRHRREVLGRRSQLTHADRALLRQMGITARGDGGRGRP